VIAFILNSFKGQFFTIEDPFLYVSWWSFVAGFITTVVVSLFTSPHPQNRLGGLVYKKTGGKNNT